MRNNNIYRSDLVCLECGNVDTIFRQSKKSRGVSHIKDLYCYKCKTETKHYEVIDVSIFMLSDKEYQDKDKVKELIKKCQQ